MAPLTLEGKRTMPVTDQQAATLQAQLAGDLAEYQELLGRLDSKTDSRGYSALLTAAFHNAVDLRFNRESTLDEVTEFVADVRARSERLRDALDPRTAERVIVAAVGGNYVHDLEPAESNKIKTVLLTALIADMHLDDEGLEEFIAKARAFADELLS
jgi:hypothetical protein